MPILFLSIQQCSDTTKLDCTHAISSHSTMLWHLKIWLYVVLIQFLPVKQCCDITKLDGTPLILFLPTMLWHHKIWLYSFYFFPSSNVVAPQWEPLMVACLDRYSKQCCGITSVTILSVLVHLVTIRLTILQPVVITALSAVVMETNIKLSSIGCPSH